MVTWAQAHGLDVKNLPIEALWQTNQPPPDWLGIQIKPSTEPPGLFVEKVITERSAAQAGIQPHDVIVRFNAHEVHDPETLFRLVGVAAIGTTVDVDIIHDGQRRTIRVTLGKRPVSRP